MIDAEKYKRVEELVNLLNHYRDEYYNNSNSEISDLEYDNLFDELERLENETGFILINSPTQTVGATSVSVLEKVKHNHPMLSLAKTKNIEDIYKYFEGKDTVCMAKMDGLTCSLRYKDGRLITAETRGDGEIGENVTHNARVIDNIPKTLPVKDEIIIDGEIIICLDDFEEINKELPEERRYKNARNLAAGSISLLDSNVAIERNMKFVAWKFIKGYEGNSFYESIMKLIEFGFIIAPIVPIPAKNYNIEQFNKSINIVKDWADRNYYPIDGCVFGYDDIAYGNELGITSHHIKSQMAFKFYDETVPTKLKYIDWTIGKTGVLTPTAVFETVTIDGTDVSRASLHNISIINELGLTEHCTVYVYKANQIIPQINQCDIDGDGKIEYPKTCPICGKPTIIVRDNETDVLMCSNLECKGKLLAKFENFVSRKCANIDGLSSATLEEFINRGYLNKFKDIYHLSEHKDEILTLNGFGQKSVDKLFESIERSRNIKLENYINALGIDGIGYSNAKAIADTFEGSDLIFYRSLEMNFDFTLIDGFGKALDNSIKYWYNKSNLAENLQEEFIFELPEKTEDKPLNGLKFCITGTFKESRDTIVSKLIDRGAIFVSGVNKKIDVLFCGDKAGSKLDKANSLGIKVVYEQELYKEYLK